MPLNHKLRLKKRAVIESVNHILTNEILTLVLDVKHTRHGNRFNALAHTFSGLITYCFYEGKLSIFCLIIKYL